MSEQSFRICLEKDKHFIEQTLNEHLYALYFKYCTLEYKVGNSPGGLQSPVGPPELDKYLWYNV